MKAVRNTEAGIQVVDVAEPERDGVEVAVTAAGICASDLAMIQAGPLPFTLGHEIAGIASDGRAVAIEPIIPCEQCDQCRGMNYHRCRLGGNSNLGFALDGGMAERVVVPERCLVALPEGFRPGDASLVEPMAVVLHGLRLGPLLAGQRVGVIGGGTIGLLAIAGARMLGCDVSVELRHPIQQAAAERLGATVGLSGEFDFVVDAATSESGSAKAVEVAAPGATLLQIAIYFGPVPLPGVQAIMKELRVVLPYTYGRHAGGRDFDHAATMLAAMPEAGEAIITHRFPLDDAPEAFRQARDRASAIKVVLEP